MQSNKDWDWSEQWPLNSESAEKETETSVAVHISNITLYAKHTNYFQHIKAEYSALIVQLKLFKELRKED